MTPFFESDQSRLRLLCEARAWLGTPFSPHACIPGAGVDCVHLCAGIYIKCGAIEMFDPPKYTCDAGPHCSDRLVTDWLDHSGRFDRLKPGLHAAIGDALCFRIGKHEYHTGILITAETFIHCARGYGVREGFLADPTYGRRLTAVYRPLAWNHL